MALKYKTYEDWQPVMGYILATFKGFVGKPLEDLFSDFPLFFSLLCTLRTFAVPRSLN